MLLLPWIASPERRFRRVWGAASWPVATALREDHRYNGEHDQICRDRDPPKMVTAGSCRPTTPWASAISVICWRLGRRAAITRTCSLRLAMLAKLDAFIACQPARSDPGFHRRGTASDGRAGAADPSVSSASAASSAVSAETARVVVADQSARRAWRAQIARWRHTGSICTMRTGSSARSTPNCSLATMTPSTRQAEWPTRMRSRSGKANASWHTSLQFSAS